MVSTRRLDIAWLGDLVKIQLTRSAAILIVLLLFTKAIDTGMLSLSIFFNSKFLQKDYS